MNKVQSSMDNQLNHIEELLAHQEQQIADLSHVVTRQWAEIDGLKKQIGRMQDKIMSLEDAPASEGLSVTEQAARDKPPHY